jgi:hypothetical protein
LKRTSSSAGEARPVYTETAPFQPIRFEKIARNYESNPGRKSFGPKNRISQVVKMAIRFHNLDYSYSKVEIRSPKPFEFKDIPSKHSRADNPLLQAIFRKIKSRLST